MMKRTTIFADEKLLNDIKQIANEEGISTAESIRQALENFIAQRKKSKKKLSFIGIGRSGQKDVSERCEELLWKGPTTDPGAKI